MRTQVINGFRWLAVILAIVIFATLGILMFNLLKGKHNREICRANLHVIWKAAKMYQKGGGFSFPQSLQATFSDIPDPRWYICPASGHNPGNTNQIDLWTDYIYVSGLNDSDPTNCVLAFCPPENHKGEGANVLFVDGSVRWYSAEEFKNLTSSPSLFYGTSNSNVLAELRSRTKVLYPHH